MSKNLKSLLKDILISRLGFSLAITNLCIALYYLNNNCWGKCGSGHPFNESAFMQYYLLFNLPGAIISVMIFNLVGIGENDFWWVKTGVKILTISIMSAFLWLTGYFIGVLYSRLKEH